MISNFENSEVPGACTSRLDSILQYIGASAISEQCEFGVELVASNNSLPLLH